MFPTKRDPISANPDSLHFQVEMGQGASLFNRHESQEDVDVEMGSDEEDDYNSLTPTPYEEEESGDENGTYIECVIDGSFLSLTGRGGE